MRKYPKTQARHPFKDMRFVGIKDYNRAWQNMKNELRNGPVTTYKLPVKPPTP